LWLDRGELGALLQLTRELLQRLAVQMRPSSPAAVRGAAGEARCPACHVPMQQHEYGAGSGATVHSCDGCRGIWTDATRLVAIQRFVLDHGSLPASDTG